MKIALINPSTKIRLTDKLEKYIIRAGSRWPHSGVKKIGTIPHYLPLPFFLGYAASLLEKFGHSVFVFDFVALDYSESEMLDELKKTEPDIIFFEPTVLTIDFDMKLIDNLKKTGITKTIILAGAYATVFAAELLQKNPNIDFIIKGEYEKKLLDLVNAICGTEKIENCKGIVYLKNEKIIDIDENSLIEPLDFLPIINRELFPSKDRPNPQIYWDGFCQNYPALQMQASRGCPYKCDFCLWNNVIYRNGKYRTFSIDRVITEMKILISKYNAKEIYFDDDDFTINKQFVSELCSAIIQNKLNIKWSCMADAVNLDERLIKLMADSGCIGVKIGIESANRQILKNLGKPIDIEKARKLADICLKYNIKLHTTFMLGLKNENLQTINETLDFIENLPVSSFQLSICSPFPGTKYYEYLKNNNFDIKMFDGKINADIQNSILKLLLNDCELQKLAKRLKYFSALWFLKKIFNFRWLLQFIRNIFRVVLGLGLNFFIFQVYSNLVDKIYSQKYREND